MDVHSVEHLIGIDPDRDRVTATVVAAVTRAEVAVGVFETTQAGYRRLVAWANQHSRPGDRAFCVEGAGSYGAGVASHLISAGEVVVEFSHPAGPASADGAKTDALDARRAALETLGRAHPAIPRARGAREALRAIETTRRGAQGARVTAINALRALLVTAPAGLRDELRGLPRAALVRRCAALRPTAENPPSERTAAKLALRALAARIGHLDNEIATHTQHIAALIRAVAPQLLAEPGVGPITAAQVYIAWSHPRRCRNEAAFARLAGVAPLDASSGQTTRHRLNRRGDRTLNQALHTITLTRIRACPQTQAYMAKRRANGKTTREARRCLKRYIARHLYRLLEHPPTTT